MEAWVDQVDALGAADLVVCHGGSGTVFGTLAAGLPLVVVPVLGDQFDNGRLVAGCGAGVTLAPDPDRGESRRVIDERDADRLRAAIATVRAGGEHRGQAQRVAGEMRASPAIDEVLDTLLSEGALS
jgi:UDP:flavonoid glycosyltransferase YjiC (YdhE family)